MLDQYGCAGGRSSFAAALLTALFYRRLSRFRSLSRPDMKAVSPVVQNQLAAPTQPQGRADHFVGIGADIARPGGAVACDHLSHPDQKGLLGRSGDCRGCCREPYAGSPQW